MTARSTDWVARAACAGHDPRLWDGAPDGPRRAELPHRTAERHRRAIAICDTCLVIRECEDATRPEDRDMIRPGTNLWHHYAREAAA